MAVAFVAVGANLEPEKNILAALETLRREAQVVASSTFYRTEPLGGRNQPAYINGVWRIETELSARDIKPQLLAPVEQRLGRTHRGDKYVSRTMDLDLVLYDDLVIDDRVLRLPHPDLQRPFVYYPVVELLEQMAGDMPRRIERRLPAPPATPPGEPLPEFTRELRDLLD